MKKINYNFLIVTIFFLFISIASCKKINIQKPVKGKLDLTNWDLKKNGSLKLNGEWEFYWNQLLTYEDFKSNNAKLSSFFKIPDTWYKYKLNNKKLKSFGYATFRVIIYINENINKNLAIKIPKMSTAYNLYINEKKIASNGIVGKSKEETKPQYMPLVADFHPESDKIELIIQVSNFNERLGGLRESIFIGEKNQIYKTREFNLSFDLLLFGCVLLMAIYHLNLFIFRKKDLVLLYFGLFCIVIAYRIIISSELFLCQLFPDISWNFIRRSFALTFFLSVPLFCMFIQSLYNNEFSKKVLFIIKIIGLFFSISAITTPSIIYTSEVAYFNYFTYFCCLYVFYVLFKALLKKREGALIFIIAFFIFFITIINDILYMETYIQSLMLVPFGLLIFIFFQVFILSRRFSLSFTKIELMSDELQKVNKKINELNINLEKKVQERTLELEYAKNEIEKTSKEKSQFFVNVAHEIKTPLTLIQNYLGSYIEKVGLNNDLKIIKQNFQKMLNDILNLLNAEKLEKGKMIYDHNQIIDLSCYLKDKIEIFSNNAAQKNIILKYDIKNNIYIKADTLAIERIINNLIDNSIKYTNNGGEILIDLNSKDDKIYIKIQDTGIGISKNLHENIFKPYYQLSTNKQNIQGIGMGLYIVKKTIDSLKGKILLESEVNKGTTFTIVLKKYELKHNDLIINQQKSFNENMQHPLLKIKEAKNQGEKQGILIVEDNIDMINFLIDYFSTNYNVYSAKNGKDALLKLKDIHSPEIIISDIMMNEMDGYEFIELLYSNNDYKNIPVIFLTAKSTNENKIKGLRKGAIDYIYKPFEIEELSIKVNSILKNRMYQKNKNTEKLKQHITRALDDYTKEPIKYNKNKYELNINKNFINVLNRNNITNREREVIDLLMKGLYYKEIASKLGISTKTIENHISKIYKKFNVQNKVELINALLKN